MSKKASSANTLYKKHPAIKLIILNEQPQRIAVSAETIHALLWHRQLSFDAIRRYL